MALPVALASYPKTLTNAHWQKEKGSFAKMAGKTGVGEALTKAEKAFGQVKWNLFDARMNGKMHSVEEVDELLAKAKSEWPKVETFRKALYAARDVAEDTQKKFKANKLIPASAGKLAGSIASECESLAVACRSMDTSDFDAEKEKLQKHIDMHRKKIKTDIKNLVAALKAALNEPTHAFWTTNVTQKFRSVANGLAVVPEFKQEFWSTWKNYDGLQHNAVTKSGDPDEEEKMTKLIKKMGQEAMALDKALG